MPVGGVGVADEPGAGGGSLVGATGSVTGGLLPGEFGVGAG